VPLPRKEVVQVWSAASLPAKAAEKGKEGVGLKVELILMLSVSRLDLSPIAEMISQC